MLLVIFIGIAMGLFFFLSVVVAGNFALKAYKLRMFARERLNSDEASKLQHQLNELHEKLRRSDIDKRVEQLEEAVFFGDFELRRKFSKLESEADNKF